MQREVFVNWVWNVIIIVIENEINLYEIDSFCDGISVRCPNNYKNSTVVCREKAAVCDKVFFAVFFFFFSFFFLTKIHLYRKNNNNAYIACDCQ